MGPLLWNDHRLASVLSAQVPLCRCPSWHRSRHAQHTTYSEETGVDAAATCQGSRPKQGQCEHPSRVKFSQPAPPWEGTAVIDGEFKTIKSTDYLGKYLILLFYPLDFTFVCPTEITAFSDRIGDFHAINTEIVACSGDSHFAHMAWISTARSQGGLGPIKLPLLSDITHSISRAYGVYAEGLGHSLRGLFIIDGKGVVRQVTTNDPPVGRSVDETLRLVQALQYADTHEEVCPADWKPGSKSIKPAEAMEAWWPKEEL